MKVNNQTTVSAAVAIGTFVTVLIMTTHSMLLEYNIKGYIDLKLSTRDAITVTPTPTATPLSKAEADHEAFCFLNPKSSKCYEFCLRHDCKE